MNALRFPIARDLDRFNRVPGAPIVIDAVLEKRRKRMEVVPKRDLFDRSNLPCFVARAAPTHVILHLPNRDGMKGQISEELLQAGHASPQPLPRVRFGAVLAFRPLYELVCRVTEWLDAEFQLVAPALRGQFPRFRFRQQRGVAIAFCGRQACLPVVRLRAGPVRN